MPLRISMTLEALPPQLLAGAPAKIIREEMTRTMAQQLIVLKNGMVQVSPQGATGQLKQAWQINVPEVQATGAVVGSVTNVSVQAIVIDEGARPHRPPPNRLVPWVRRKLGITGKRGRRVAGAISVAISRRGLPQRQTLKGVFTRKFKALNGVFVVQLGLMRDRIVRRLQG